MKREWGATVAQIMDTLHEFGEASSAEVAKHLKLDRMNVATIMSRMRKPGAKMPKRIYVVRYVHDHEGDRRYPRPVYAIGDWGDAAKPKADPKANKRRYTQGLRKRMTANSVFNLGLTRRQYSKRGNIEATGSAA